MSVQLALGIALRDDARFDNFYVGGNQQVLTCLNEIIKQRGDSIVYLWGGQQSGVTHLLQACCHAVFERQGQAIFLPLSQAGLTPDVLQDLETVDLVCIDDIECALGQRVWEEQLLHLYNRVRDGGARLLLGAKQMPYAAVCELPDLKSRLSWGLSLRVDQLSEEEKFAAFKARVERRGLIVAPQTLDFLWRRYGHDMKALFATVQRLDQASLAEKRKLTIPFIKHHL